MADGITLKLLKILIVFLISTWNQLSSMYLVRVKPSKDVYVTADDIGACHRIGKSNRNSKKTIVCLINRKHCKCALVDRKKLKSFNSESIVLCNVHLMNSCRSSQLTCSVKKGVLRIFAKFTGKHLCQSLFFNKAVKCMHTKVHILMNACGYYLVWQKVRFPLGLS